MAVRVALAQVGSTADKARNLDTAAAYMERAADGGAQLVVFPEVFMNHFPPDTPLEVQADSAADLDGPFAMAMAALARDHGTWCVFGMRERSNDITGRSYNTTVIVDAQGKRAAFYRKTHLYDAFGAQESAKIAPGDELFTPLATPFGQVGLFVCYELRFPEVAREQVARGAHILLVPSGWVRGPLKEHHWQTLVTARALENTTFVVACDQVSDYYCGRSLVVDPMGVVMVDGGEEEQLLFADLDLERIPAVREKLPSYRHRRPALYTALRQD